MAKGESARASSLLSEHESLYLVKTVSIYLCYTHDNNRASNPSCIWSFHTQTSPGHVTKTYT